MAKVTYAGAMEGLAYHSTPSRKEYVFIRGVPTEVSDSEDIEHFKSMASRPGSDFKVDLDIVERVAEKVKEIIKPEIKVASKPAPIKPEPAVVMKPSPIEKIIKSQKLRSKTKKGGRRWLRR